MQSVIDNWNILQELWDECLDEHVLAICSFYGDDFDQHNQHTHLTILGTLFDGLNKDSTDITLSLIDCVS